MARILIIDDEELVRLTLRQMLESRGHTIVEAENGNKAFRMLEDFGPDLVITRCRSLAPVRAVDEGIV